jgi:hypothetical protein
MIPCPFCNKTIDATAYFCPLCGKKVREKPVSTSFWPVAGLMISSILLPPLNLVWTARYLKSSEPKTKRIGIISLIITLIALVVGIWLAVVFAQNVNEQVNKQMKQYQYLGF